MQDNVTDIFEYLEKMSGQHENAYAIGENAYAFDNSIIEDELDNNTPLPNR